MSLLQSNPQCPLGLNTFWIIFENTGTGRSGFWNTYIVTIIYLMIFNKCDDIIRLKSFTILPKSYKIHNVGYDNRIVTFEFDWKLPIAKLNDSNKLPLFYFVPSSLVTFNQSTCSWYIILVYVAYIFPNVTIIPLYRYFTVNYTLRGLTK